MEHAHQEGIVQFDRLKGHRGYDICLPVDKGVAVASEKGNSRRP